MPQDTVWLDSGKTDYILQEPPAVSSEIDTTHQISPDGDYINRRPEQNNSEWAFPLAVFILVLIWAIIKARFGKSKGWVELGGRGRPVDEDGYIIEDDQEETAVAEDPCLTYYGNELNFSVGELTAVLTKRSVYFTKLNPFEKEKFIERLKIFIADKVFKIHDTSGFKEMPILISASAIQLSFGLEHFQLPDFPFIHIYPDAFVRIDQTIRILEGNVSGDCINISWKYFLAGFQVPNDGQNVGLHEMAHAYYYQNLQCRDCEDENFKVGYLEFEVCGDKAFRSEAEPGNDLYSDYALKNFQEFWAESVEIFFEKPVLLRANYPELYDTISKLLNQDTARHQL